MFCPNCGNAEQTPDTYCRSCGEFLTSSSLPGRLAFGGRTPQQNLTSINVLSLIAAILSFHVGIWMYLTQFNVPFVFYLGAAVLLCNAAWHLSNFVIGMRLKKRLNNAKEDSVENVRRVSPVVTRELLPLGNQADAVPISVTEDTTKHLAEKIKRPLS